MRFDARLARRIAVWAMAFGLLLRAAYAWHIHQNPDLPTNVDGYETIAFSLLDRGEYALEPGRPTSMREPAYPLFIAGVYGALGRHAEVILVIHCLLSVGTGWLLWRTGRRLFGEGVALSSLLAFMLYPQSIYYCAYFFRETWLCFWFGVMLFASLDWSVQSGRSAGDRGAALGGVAAAAFGLSNSAVLPACALSGLLLLWVAPAQARLRRLALYLAPLLLAFGAWTARNWVVHGRFVAGSTHGGEEFLRALIVPPEDQTTSRPVEIMAADPDFAVSSRYPEAERNNFLTKAAFRWIKSHPALFASRMQTNIVKYWKLWPYKMSYRHSYAVLVLVSLLSDGWIIPLAFLGLWLFRARWREAPVLPASIFAMTLVYGAVHAVIRYRLPLMGGMILLACAAASRLRPETHPAS